MLEGGWWGRVRGQRTAGNRQTSKKHILKNKLGGGEGK
jgi:hypothetical protein